VISNFQEQNSNMVLRGTLRIGKREMGMPNSDLRGDIYAGDRQPTDRRRNHTHAEDITEVYV